MSASGIISSSWLLVLRTLFYNRYWMRTANVICSSMRGVLSELAHAHHSVCAAHALATGLISDANAQPECQFYDELVVYRPQLLYYSNGDEWEPTRMSPTIDKCQRRCSFRSTDLIIKLSSSQQRECMFFSHFTNDGICWISQNYLVAFTQISLMEEMSEARMARFMVTDWLSAPTLPF